MANNFPVAWHDYHFKLKLSICPTASSLVKQSIDFPVKYLVGPFHRCPRNVLNFSLIIILWEQAFYCSVLSFCLGINSLFRRSVNVKKSPVLKHIYTKCWYMVYIMVKYDMCYWLKRAPDTSLSSSSIKGFIQSSVVLILGQQTTAGNICT